MNKQIIGYVESLQIEAYGTTNGVTINIDGLVGDLMLAAYELTVIDGALYVFKLIEKKYNGEKEAVLITNNFTIITK